MLLAVVGIFVFSFPSRHAQSLLGLAEGEACKDSPEGAWSCTTLKKCPHVDVRILRPSICSFRGRDPIICCPPSKTMTKSEMSCQASSKLCSKLSVIMQSRALGRTEGWNDDDDSMIIQTADGKQATAIESAGSTTTPTTTFRDNETDHLALATTVLPETFNLSEGRSLSNLSDTTGVVQLPKLLTTSAETEPDVKSLRQMVVGGHFALPRIHKHMAMIGYGPENDKSWNCGGSLISDIWVLSAAHCTNPSGGLGAARWARLGELDQSTTTDDARPQDRRIVRRINHPDYKEPLVYHDIALYKLSSSVAFDQFVAPICLQTTFNIKEPKATVIGWGRTDFAGEVSNKLMEADITLINHTECSRLYGKGDQATPRGIDRMAMLCAGEIEGGKDACSFTEVGTNFIGSECEYLSMKLHRRYSNHTDTTGLTGCSQGDSGGPLVVSLPGSCLQKQVGITSFGKDCGLPNQPGIYTRVSTYIPWIESIVWP